MKRLLLILMTALTVACSSDPVYHGLTPKEKESYGQSIAGEYPGRYEIVYTGNDGEKLRLKTVNDITLSVSDLAMHSIIFNDFPLSLLAQVVDDEELGQALTNVPDMGLTASYEFIKADEQGHVNWNFDVNPVSLSLTYGGKKHNIVLQFSNAYTFVEFSKGQLDAGTAFEQGTIVQLQLITIYDGNKPLYDFGGWGNDNRVLLAQFYFGLK